jgi:hypothetical protein
VLRLRLVYKIESAERHVPWGPVLLANLSDPHPVDCSSAQCLFPCAASGKHALSAVHPDAPSVGIHRAGFPDGIPGLGIGGHLDFPA